MRKVFCAAQRAVAHHTLFANLNGLPGAEPERLLGEFHHGIAALKTGQIQGGLERYASGGWRRGEFT